MWSTESEKIFNKIISTKVIMPFDDKLQLILATDALPNGVGAVIDDSR